MTPPKAMILAAGRGQRLAPLTDRMPKPMVPIGGEPLVVHQLRWLQRAGVREVVINLHHLGEQIEAAVGDGGSFGVRVLYSHEEEPLETGGGIKKALPHLRPAPFLVLNGDIWTDYPFHKLLAARPRRAHLVLTPKPPHKPVADFHFAGAATGQGHRAVGRKAALDDLTYCGIAVLAEELFTDAGDGRFSLRDLLFRAADRNLLTGERFDGVWIDIGAPEQLRHARQLVAAMRRGQSVVDGCSAS